MPRRACVISGVLLVAVAAGACEPETKERSAPPRAETSACPTGFADTMETWGDVGFNGAIAIIRGADRCVAAVGVRDRVLGLPMTDDTVFAIGSVSKSFTAAAVLGLVAEGRLRLSDRAGDLVPGLSGPASAATIEQLLTHTSGLHGDAGPDHRPLSAPDAVAAISALPSTFAAGTDFGYTNAGYTLLALVIEQLSGDYRDYVMSTVLAGRADAGFWDGEPAAVGPRAVGYTEEGRSGVTGEFPGPHWATSGNGDLAMTVPTLAGLTASLFRGELLPPRATAQLEKPRWDQGDGTSETFGWVRYDDRLFGAEGFAAAGGGGDTGHNAIVAYLPGTDTAIAIASSTPEVTAEQLMQTVIPAVVAGGPIPEPAGAEVSAPDAEMTARAAGTYRLRDGSELVVGEADEGVGVEAVGDGAVDALFSLPTAVSPGDVAAHEAGVVDLLTGESDVGEDERAALSDALGGIDEVSLQGTVAQGNELRTYVLVSGSEESLLLWYALDEQGGVGAAQGPAERPALVFEQQRRSTLISSDPTGSRSDVRLTVNDDGSITIDNGATVVTAQKTS